ncbi:amidase [Kribbella turkmenica]|uniref:Amidase n=1 Tax=Kribbella turkmenica TaxID=2530375 RepID=A0A4R4W458_9ACTN|nr:amidase [Kribbella turkmenica]TDD13312.1 amidase [Kribbella turkmenica]
MTAIEVGRALRRREISARELVGSALRRTRELNPTLNAFALIDEEGARAAARLADEQFAAGVDLGPLHGIPVAVKDLVDMAGLPTSCGSGSSFGALATADAEVVRRLRDAGAVIIGKTTLHEFAYGATGDRSVHGASRNPVDPSRMSGGSSGGSAVAVAAGMVPIAVGTDTAGSVRVPAALCGVVGFKPAYDAVPSAGVYPLAPSLDHVGVFAATSEDALVAYQAIGDRPVTSLLPDVTNGHASRLAGDAERVAGGAQGVAGDAKRLAGGAVPVAGGGGQAAGGAGRVGSGAGRVGGAQRAGALDVRGGAGRVAVGWIPPGAIAATDPRIEKLTRRRLDGAGFAVDVVSGFPKWERSLFEEFSVLQGREAFRVHEHHLAADQDLIDPEVLARLRKGGEVTDRRYARAGEARHEIAIMVDELLTTYDVLALPTVPIVAPAVGARSISVAGAQLEVRQALLSLTCLWNLTGSPAISVPVGRVDGLPVAVQLVSAPGNEQLLFAAARELEIVDNRTKESHAVDPG